MTQMMGLSKNFKTAFITRIQEVKVNTFEMNEKIDVLSKKEKKRKETLKKNQMYI